MKRHYGLVAMLVLLCAPAANATSLSIIGGVTDVKLTSLDLFNTLGLDLMLVGSATISGSVVTFPITGGSVDTETGFALIEHDGSGIGISDGTTDVMLTDFLIDTENALLSGVAAVDGSVLGVVPIFDISATLRLTLTPTAAGALSDAFKLTIPAGTEIGVASVRPKTVPLPGAVWLMISGMFVLSRLRKRVSI